MNKIPKEYETNSVEHRFGGNGWAVVDVIPEDFTRVVYVGKGEVGTQAFLVWSKLLKVEKAIDDKIQKKVNQFREKLASGDWKIKNTLLAKTTP